MSRGARPLVPPGSARPFPAARARVSPGPVPWRRPAGEAEAAPLCPACAGPSPEYGPLSLPWAPQLRLRLGSLGVNPLPASLLSSPPFPPLPQPRGPARGAAPRALYRSRAGSYRDSGICFFLHEAVVNYAFLMVSVISWSGTKRTVNYDMGCAAYYWRRQRVKVWPVFLFLFLENRCVLISFSLFSFILEH